MIPRRDVNLFCCGPSLNRAEPDLSLTSVAINLAIEKFPCDWWVCGDDKPFLKSPNRPRVGIVTKESVVGQIRSGNFNSNPPWDHNLHVVSLKHYPVLGKPWYSSWYALLFCQTLGAKNLHIYGMDMVGNTYFKDAPYSGNMSTVRWEKEKNQVEKILWDFQNHHGINVIKH